MPVSPPVHLVHDLVSGLRFQPIINLQNESLVGWEVLTWLKDEEPEIWFQSLPIETYLSIFLWQASVAQKCDGLFWLNLPVAVLISPFCIAEINKMSHHKRLVIEIQDPGKIISLDFMEKKLFAKNVYELKSSGWRVWLDDITMDIVENIMLSDLPIDGVKIDKSETNNHNQLTKLIKKASKISKNILVEGIESQEQLWCAYNSGANFGQGFMWEEKKINMDILRVYF